MRQTAVHEKSAARIKEWLLAILRFAVTLAPADRVAVLAVANELDRPSDTREAFSFFARTSAEVCNAIASADDPSARAILRAHLARIDEPRIRRAFEAALDRDWSLASSAPKKPGRPLLWKGLADTRRSPH